MKSQIMILIVGHNASGKSTLSKKLASELQINIINGDMIRDMLISKIRFYSGTHYSYPNEKIKSANKLVQDFRKNLTKELLLNKESVIIDGAGITKRRRKVYLDLAKKIIKGIKPIIIEIDVKEQELLNRLNKRDKNK